MFQYEYEKPRRTAEWSRVYPSGDGDTRSWPIAPGSSQSSPSDAGTVSNYSRRALPLPPVPVVCSRPHAHSTKPTVPLKVWIVASASCFAVCAALVLATVVITKWGTSETYTTHEYFEEQAAPVYSHPRPLYPNPATQAKLLPSTQVTDISSDPEVLENDLEYPYLEKLPIFKNVVANREKNKKIDAMNKKPDTLISKTQIHPIHDILMHHPEKKIEKKDKPKAPTVEEDIQNDVNNKEIPEFKPTLPDVIYKHQIKLPDGYVAGLRKFNAEYDEYFYNDENLYDDYMQSNTMTSYLIEKVQELHDWITTDPDFDMTNATAQVKPNAGSNNDFSHLLKALNESLVEGNVTIVMTKLKDIYFGENYTNTNHPRKVILTNSTDLLSFGILSLDTMLLHNIQLMAWESQETARNKMLKDPDVFAFNALFLEPSQIEAKRNEIFNNHEEAVAYPASKRQSLRQDPEDFDIGRNILESILEVGMSTARAAIHLGRAYKNTKLVLSALHNRDTLNGNIQNQLSRNIDGNAHALNRLQSSFSKNDSAAVVSEDEGFTELDCVWLLYCKNLVATSKLNAPYGTMARINGMALRMLTGELSANKALDTMLYEALTGWTELRCSDMFPRCSKVDAASVVLESVLQPLRKSTSKAR